MSTQDQQTLALQREAMEAYVQQRAWEVAVLVEEIGSGGRERWQREALMQAARRRDIDAIVVWRLDRWGRSLADLVGTLHELHALGVGFISLREALDFATPTGRALAGLLAIFAEFERESLRERVKAGIAQARKRGPPHGRPPTVAHHRAAARQLHATGLSQRTSRSHSYKPLNLLNISFMGYIGLKNNQNRINAFQRGAECVSQSAIARQLGISRTSVRRFLR